MARRSVIGALALLLGGSGCSILAFDKHKSIAGWYVGPPEIASPVSGTERASIDGGRLLRCELLQTPELFLQPLQPIGGWTDPEPTTVSDDAIDEAFVRGGR